MFILRQAQASHKVLIAHTYLKNLKAFSKFHYYAYSSDSAIQTGHSTSELL